MKKHYLAILFSWILLVLPSMGSWAQEKTIKQHRELSGTVTDNHGQPLPGTTVRIKGTMQGTVTDTNGHYTLRGEWAMGDIVLFTFKYL